MKKVLTVFIALIACASIMAQEHLKFKGIPIEGSMTSFCQKLEAKGLIILDKTNNSTLLTGNFTDRIADIGVKATDNGDVYAVSVMFEPIDEWSTLVNIYDQYKALYTRKYGKPTFSEENNPARSNSNTALMAELRNGTVSYLCIWETTGGNIVLNIQHILYGNFVVISYLDKKASDILDKNNLEDI